VSSIKWFILDLFLDILEEKAVGREMPYDDIYRCDISLFHSRSDCFAWLSKKHEIMFKTLY
jgi:hypothetical protein